MLTKQSSSSPAPERLITGPIKLAAAFIFLAAIICMWPVYISNDSDWILYMAKQVSQGKEAYVDFYEVNPPLIIWLNLPAVFLSAVTGLSLAGALKLYIFGLIALVLGVSQALIERVKPPSPQILFLALTYVLTFAQAEQFGQREHFMFILIIPYIFLIAARAKRVDVPKSWIWGIAAVAAISICIKPYFVLIPALCEAYLLLRLKRQTFKRAEPYIMVGLGLSYLAAILLITPEYISTVVKHASIVYQIGVGANWQAMLAALAPFIMASAFAVIVKFYSKLYLKDIAPLYVVISLFVIANLGIFIIQSKGWDNHIYPMHAMSIVLIAVMLHGLFKTYRSKPQVITLLLGIMFIGPLFQMGVLNLFTMQRSSNAALYFDKRIVAFETNNLYEAEPVESVFIISAHIFIGFPFINESGLDWGSRLPSMWLTPGVQRLKALGALSPEALAAETFSKNTIGEDIALRKPDIIFVDVKDKKRYFDAPYNYVTDYSQNDVFMAAWGAYEWVESDGNYALYRRR